MSKNKKILTVLTALFCVMAADFTSFAAKPDTISQDSLTSAMVQAEKPVDGTIVRIDVPDENGNYITLEGADAQKWWNDAVLETKKSLAEDLSVLKGEPSTTGEEPKPTGMFTFF